MNRNEGLLRLRRVQEIVPVCRSTIYNMIKRGDFPAPVKVGRSTFWKSSDVNAFLNRLGGDAGTEAMTDGQ